MIQKVTLLRPNAESVYEDIDMHVDPVFTSIKPLRLHQRTHQCDCYRP